ncbi:choice-of-anchor A family protein [Stieleria sp. TO1_6]|uniref:collagen-binding domain-containing protein n=1 Tax=Stieleria tagensis TaxID=2956795 RepID=UPI00209A774D|nr:collagen-binding domain-containing protein [Stieleria tagensis]MCO8124916.1 choice-of-anchor A family protein [Stieleria tagensis]
MFRSLAFVLATSLTALHASAGVINDFNLIALGNVTGTSEVEGRTLVFGNINGSAKNFAVNSAALTKPVTTPGVNQQDGLIVGGKVHGTIQVNQGGVRVGGSSTGAHINNADYTTFNDAEIPSLLSQTLTEIGQTTSYLNSLTANSTANLKDMNKAIFTSTPGVDRTAVFDLDASLFKRNGSMDLQGDLDADLFLFRFDDIKIAGGTAFNVFNEEFGLDKFQERIVWYFPNATTVTLPNGLGGSVIAPLADLTLRSPIEGTVVANNVHLTGEIHLPSTTLDIPTVPGRDPDSDGSVPEPSSMATFALLAIGGLLRRRSRA